MEARRRAPGGAAPLLLAASLLLVLGRAARVAQGAARGAAGAAAGAAAAKAGAARPGLRHLPAALASLAWLRTAASSETLLFESPGDFFGPESKYDADGDGALDAKEFVRAVAESVDDHDLSTDGTLTDEEMLFYQGLFSLADEDADGKLTIEEMLVLNALAGDALEGATRDFLRKLSEAHYYFKTAQELDAAVWVLKAVGTEASAAGLVRRHDFLVMAKGVLKDAKWRFLTGRMLDWLPAVFEAADLDENGMLTEDEADFLTVGVDTWWRDGHWKIGFQGFDTADGEHEGSGRADEGLVEGEGAIHGGARSGRHAMEVTDEAVEGTLQDLDEDGDGRVGLSEFIDAARDIDQREGGVERALKLFVEHDMDGDGYLERHELGALLAQAYSQM